MEARFPGAALFEKGRGGPFDGSLHRSAGARFIEAFSLEVWLIEQRRSFAAARRDHKGRGELLPPRQPGSFQMYRKGGGAEKGCKGQGGGGLMSPDESTLWHARLARHAPDLRIYFAVPRLT